MLDIEINVDKFGEAAQHHQPTQCPLKSNNEITAPVDFELLIVHFPVDHLVQLHHLHLSVGYHFGILHLPVFLKHQGEFGDALVYFVAMVSFLLISFSVHVLNFQPLRDEIKPPLLPNLFFLKINDHVLYLLLRSPQHPDLIVNLIESIHIQLLLLKINCLLQLDILRRHALNGRHLYFEDSARDGRIVDCLVVPDFRFENEVHP